MSRSCHSATFSSAGATVARISRASPVRFSDSTGLRLCGIAEEPFCPGAKYSSASRTSVRCRWRISVASRSMPAAISARVMKNAAWRSRGITCVEIGSGARPSLLRDVCLDRRVDVGEGADRARNRAGRDLAARRGEALAVASELGLMPGELQPEGRRLGMDAVAAADRRRVFVLDRAPLQRRQQPVEIGEQEVGGLLQLHREAGVEHVARGHALVDKARLGADMLGEVGQKGDHVVMRLALDLVDAPDLESAALSRTARAALSGMTPSAACASQA